MENRIEEYSVGELARASGVSIRMLHHYDAIGLLKPAHVATNGYRFYGRTEALRLQEILFYRSAGMPLKDIAEFLDNGHPASRLSEHREKLVKALSEQAAIIATLDRTISNLNGDDPMTLEDLYRPFSREKQAEYEEWLIETYGDDMAAAIEKSRSAANGQPTQVANAQVEKLKQIEARLVAAYEAGVSPRDADLSEHRNWVSEMWGQSCDAKAYAGLSEIYLSHPDFIARYEALSQGFSQWLTSAMVAWSKTAP